MSRRKEESFCKFCCTPIKGKGKRFCTISQSGIVGVPGAADERISKLFSILMSNTTRRRFLGSTAAVALLAKMGPTHATILLAGTGSATSGLPALPAGTPTHFSLGLAGTDATSLAWMTGSGIAWDYRWGYSSAAAFNVVGIQVSDCLRGGYLPVITWYTPISSNGPVLSNWASTSFMSGEYTLFIAALKSINNWNLWCRTWGNSTLVTISGDNTTATYTGTSGTDVFALSGNFHGTGKWVVRFHLNIVGVNGIGVGFASTSATSDSFGYLGYLTDSLALYNGTLFINDTNVTTGLIAGSFASGDDIDVAIDFDNKKLWMRQNNGIWNANATYVPGDTHGADISSCNFSAGNPFSPAASFKYNGDAVSFGAAPTITGFAAWNSSPTPSIIIDYEPDLIGFFQQQGAAGNTYTEDPTQVVVSVDSSGVADVAGFANNAAGFMQAIKHLRDTYAPTALLGYHTAWWGYWGYEASGTSQSGTNASAIAAGQAISRFYNALGATYDVIMEDTADADSGTGGGTHPWWNATAFESFRNFIGALTTNSRMRAFLWQTPVGNTLFQACNNTSYHYQDDRVEYFLPPLTGVTGYTQSPLYNASNMANFAAAGLIGILWGTGGSNTDPFALSGSGVYNPGALGSPGNPVNTNSNAAVATVSDDDGGNLRRAATAYYASPYTLPTH